MIKAQIEHKHKIQKTFFRFWGPGGLGVGVGVGGLGVGGLGVGVGVGGLGVGTGVGGVGSIGVGVGGVGVGGVGGCPHNFTNSSACCNIRVTIAWSAGARRLQDAASTTNTPCL